MSTPITLNLPDNLYQEARRLAQQHQRELQDVLVETLTLSLIPLSQPVATLSDTQVLTLTQLRLPPIQEKRLAELLDHQQAATLTPPEQQELQALMEVYETRLLQQAQALNEAVKRGLMQPLEG
ncbi:MAG: hypothetical protein F6K03_14070 [Kamptonema sp. SIO4C4]|nr:hypothetical protein [Kamptonema sp. SIO4C4]